MQDGHIAPIADKRTQRTAKRTGTLGLASRNWSFGRAMVRLTFTRGDISTTPANAPEVYRSRKNSSPAIVCKQQSLLFE
jgi:hypothetical protein